MELRAPSRLELLEAPAGPRRRRVGRAPPVGPQPEEARVMKDAHGTVLADGDSITLIKDLKLKGSSQVIKGGTKAKGIRLVDGDHEISCKIDGSAIGLKACFVKKA